MASLKAFKALRPIPRLASKVAALPYDVINSKEAKKSAENNPYSFLHVDKAEIDLSSMINIYDERVYTKARENLQVMVRTGVLIKDKKDCFYIYRLSMGSHVQTGLVVCVSIDDYINNVVKKHEETRKDKEQDRINHVKYCNANTGPIFMTYKARENINNAVDMWINNRSPVYDFIADDEIRHTAWLIDDDTVIGGLAEDFRTVESLYIADGHHRAASAVEVGKIKREENPQYKGDEEFNYFLSVLFPHNNLKILDYNRVIKDLCGYDYKDFLKKAGHKFTIEEYKGEGCYKPEGKHCFGMYLNHKWYRLTAKEGTFDPDDSIGSLDVSILQNNLLEPVLKIKDPKTDTRIDFVGGIRGLKELERMVNEDMAVAFSMYPTTIEEIMSIADENEVMPPKSTWFEPKLRSGVFIHELD